MNWTEDAPEFAERVVAAFDKHKHKTLATLRNDGSPRISGTEASFHGGAVWFGSMERGVKARDLLRDGRFALHSATVDASEAMVDAKVAGVAVEIADEEARAKYGVTGDNHLFRGELHEAVLISLGGDPADHMVIESWHPGRGYERRTRD